jgi:hypothetical protein
MDLHDPAEFEPFTNDVAKASTLVSLGDPARSALPNHVLLECVHETEIRAQKLPSGGVSLIQRMAFHPSVDMTAYDLSHAFWAASCDKSGQAAILFDVLDEQLKAVGKEKEFEPTYKAWQERRRTRGLGT